MIKSFEEERFDIGKQHTLKTCQMPAAKVGGYHM